MAGNVSKNAHREGAKVLTSRWGGAIKMKSVFENGKLRHIAYCEKTGNTARKPRVSSRMASSDILHTVRRQAIQQESQRISCNLIGKRASSC